MPEDYSDYSDDELEDLYHELSGRAEELNSDSIAYEELMDEVYEIEDEIQRREEEECYDEDEEFYEDEEDGYTDSDDSIETNKDLEQFDSPLNKLLGIIREKDPICWNPIIRSNYKCKYGKEFGRDEKHSIPWGTGFRCAINVLRCALRNYDNDGIERLLEGLTSGQAEAEYSETMQKIDALTIVLEGGEDSWKDLVEKSPSDDFFKHYISRINNLDKDQLWLVNRALEYGALNMLRTLKERLHSGGL